MLNSRRSQILQAQLKSAIWGQSNKDVNEPQIYVATLINNSSLKLQKNNPAMDAGAHGLSGPIAREFVEEEKGPGSVSVTTLRLRTVEETV